MAEGEERLLSEVGVAVAVLTAHLAVEHWLLADVDRERDRKLARRVQLAEQRLGEGAARLPCRNYSLEDRRGMLAEGGSTSGLLFTSTMIIGLPVFASLSSSATCPPCSSSVGSASPLADESQVIAHNGHDHVGRLRRINRGEDAGGDRRRRSSSRVRSESRYRPAPGRGCRRARSSSFSRGCLPDSGGCCDEPSDQSPSCLLIVVGVGTDHGNELHFAGSTGAGVVLEQHEALARGGKVDGAVFGPRDLDGGAVQVGTAGIFRRDPCGTSARAGRAQGASISDSAGGRCARPR